MDLIAIMAALFLNLSTGCDALKADVMRAGGQDYLIQSWTCADKKGSVHLWRTWQRECVANNGQRYFGRAYFLEDTTTHLGIYHNRFGEIQGGFGASIEQAYVGLCGS
jgi:hypothetical protein